MLWESSSRFRPFKPAAACPISILTGYISVTHSFGGRMNTERAQTASIGLVFARHLVGMAIVALANPLIYSGGGAYQWSVGLGVALLGSAAIYGALAIFMTERAKAGWPNSFFLLAWVLLGLMLFGNWTKSAPSRPPFAQNSPSAPSVNTFTYEEAVATPAQAAQATPVATAADIAAKEHYRQIYAAHPDANDVVQSPAFNEWIRQHSQYARVLADGTTHEVISMLSNFKHRPAS